MLRILKSRAQVWVLSLVLLFCFALSPQAGQPESLDKFHMTNVDHQIEAEFDLTRTLISPMNDSEWQVEFVFAGFGWQGSETFLSAQTISTSGNNIDIAYSGIVEWYKNSSSGIEHGFNVANPPSGSGTNLVIKMNVNTDLEINSIVGNCGAELCQDSQVILAYDKLKAFDAVGADLPICLQLTTGGWDIVVDTSGAQFPIVIDPVIARTSLPLYGTATGTHKFQKAINQTGTSYAEISIYSGSTAYISYYNGGTPSDPSDDSRLEVLRYEEHVVTVDPDCGNIIDFYSTIPDANKFEVILTATPPPVGGTDEQMFNYVKNTSGASVPEETVDAETRIAILKPFTDTIMTGTPYTFYILTRAKPALETVTASVSSARSVTANPRLSYENSFVRLQHGQDPKWNAGPNVAAGINPNTGAFELSDSDLFVKGRGLDFSFTRYYDSGFIYGECQRSHFNYIFDARIPSNPTSWAGIVNDKFSSWKSPLGTAWSSPWFQRLRRKGGNSLSSQTRIHHITGTGESFEFRYSGLLDGSTNIFALNDKNINELTFIEADREFVLTSGGGLKRVFHDFTVPELAGRLKYVEDRLSNRITLIYSGKLLTQIQDSMNRNIELEYDANGLLTGVTDFSGRMVNYEYENDQLTKVLQPEIEGLARREVVYTYHDDPDDSFRANGIETVTDARGNLVVTNTFSDFEFSYNVLPNGLGDTDYNRVINQQIGSGNFKFDYELISDNSHPELFPAPGIYSATSCMVNDPLGAVAQFVTLPGGLFRYCGCMMNLQIQVLKRQCSVIYQQVDLMKLFINIMWGGAKVGS